MMEDHALSQTTGPAAGDLITLEKRNARGHLVVSYPGWLVQSSDPILILARWNIPDLVTPYVTFAQGDLLLEAYHRQRPYNVFALYNGRDAPNIDWAETLSRAGENARDQLCRLLPDAALKGLYINFTRPVQFDPQRRRLAWFDLDLDIWVPAEGPPLLLDEAEYRALNLAETEPDLARAIEQAKRGWLSGSLRNHPCSVNRR